MKTSSAKAKGRRLAAAFARMIREAFGLEEDDVRVTPSGVNGPDVQLSPLAQRVFPFAVESKNTESLNIWKAIAQAKEHVKPGQTPIVVFARNRTSPWIAMPVEDFFDRLYPSAKTPTPPDSGELKDNPGDAVHDLP